MASEQASPEADRATTPVSVPTDIVRMLRVISAHRGKPQSELLDPVIRPWVAKEYRAVVAEINELAAR